jgi:hypothetical protein
MSKAATIASLVRNAAKEEADFVATIVEIFEDDDIERVAEFFDRVAPPRSLGLDTLSKPLPSFDAHATRVVSLAEEAVVSKGIQRFLDRHERKMRWHATHPAADGIENVLLLFRTAMLVTNLRLNRLRALMKAKEELTPDEWSTARELMNRSYLSFRNFLAILAGDWVDAMLGVVTRDELAEKLGTFYELVDDEIRVLEDFRGELEERRQDLTVTPEGYPPVKPPNYFGGDLLGRGPWKQFWSTINNRAHHFREATA